MSQRSGKKLVPFGTQALTFCSACFFSIHCHLARLIDSQYKRYCFKILCLCIGTVIFRKEVRQIYKNAKKDARILYDKVKLHPLFCLICIIIFIIVLLSLIVLPPWRVSHFEINNTTTEATLENQYLGTLTQIIGGSAVLLGLYFAWGNIETAKDGQITERFTRAIDQLGNNNSLGIRLGGIYALERILNESDKDYWPIMEILTAHIRESSPIKSEHIQKQNKVSLDVQAILTVIGRRKYFFNYGESDCLDLHEAYLQGANLVGAHLEKVILYRANLKEANLEEAYLEGANLRAAKLDSAQLKRVNFEGADLFAATLEGVNLEGANLRGANLGEVHLEGADLKGADLEGADLEGAHLKKVDDPPKFPGLSPSCNVTFKQLSKVKTLYDAELDEELLIPLKKKHPDLFESTGKSPEDEFFDMSEQ